MSFKYPLQKVVDLKGSQKAMAEWEYAASLGALRREEERLEQLLQERTAVERELAQISHRPVALTRLLELQQYIDALDERIRRQHDGVAAAAKQAENRQQQLADKMVDEKVWLNARDKAFARFQTEWLLKEQNELDEIAIVRAAASRG